MEDTVLRSQPCSWSRINDTHQGNPEWRQKHKVWDSIAEIWSSALVPRASHIPLYQREICEILRHVSLHICIHLTWHPPRHTLSETSVIIPNSVIYFNTIYSTATYKQESVIYMAYRTTNYLWQTHTTVTNKCTVIIPSYVIQYSHSELVNMFRSPVGIIIRDF
jgi:hypothetical protein